MNAHSSPTIPEAASSSRSSVKDTLFLSKAESEWMVVGRGGVPALGPEPGPQPPEPEPERDRVLVDRVGELGQRKIPGLRLTDLVPSIQQSYRWGGCTETEQKDAEVKMAEWQVRRQRAGGDEEKVSTAAEIK